MEENEEQDKNLLRGQLKTFLDQARENETKMHRFHAQEMRLISTSSLSELVQIILFDYRKTFALEFVSLYLYDPGYEIQRILGDEANDLIDENLLVFNTDRDPLTDYYQDNEGPLLGPYDETRHGFLSNNSIPNLKSLATLPLIRHGQIVGSLNLGSRALSRFNDESATDFLQRLATIFTICLENATIHDRLKKVGLTDSLTGVNNRRFFDQRIGEEVARSVRSLEPIACLFLDIDHFKEFNDKYGHPVGDQVLREVAALIRVQLRNSDVLGRYGGEEFAVLLPNTSGLSALEIAQRIRENIADNDFTLPHASQNGGLNVSVSIGVADQPANTIPTDSGTLVERLLKRADIALYDAKRSGRDQVKIAEYVAPAAAAIGQEMAVDVS
jgi:two-component system cell cycle response regulator